jgi:UDP-N-acetylmuramate dehydrogenase
MIQIKHNIRLAPFTTFKIGGPAKFFCEVEKEEDFLEVLSYAKKNKLEVFVLAGGSNVIISDDGFSGLVIKIQNSCLPAGTAKLKIKNSSIECGAGVMLSQVVSEATKNSLTGLEWAAGIPGAVGGAVRGNAGAYGGEIKDSLVSVRVLELSETQSKIKVADYKTQDCKFSYRDSIFKQNKNLIILSCVLKLQKGNRSEIESKAREVVGKRTEKLPCDPSAGSFFQNPTVTDAALIAKFEKDASCVCRGGRIPAGWVIDELGLRGKKMGGVMVSEKHANFVINLGEGKAQDVVMLASFIKQQARAKLGVQLKEEVQYVGF